MSNLSGHCNCGAIKVTIPGDSIQGLCHCTSCRRSSGSICSGNFVVQKKDLQIAGEPKVYTAKGSSGNDTYRYFCGTCGSAIYTGLEAGDPNFVKTGLFNPGDVPAPKMELFCRNMESWEKVHEGAERKEEQ
ncbi:Mss4-like protein [Dioszegia hungarica]|uniref:Mss4-like protein n=1 Tax=Dioszegia hungarica TaxID=4972 RepID=A0AA38H670_9TREE|nr:Mss4-like protein [Dioszegia hungarica]KAI9633294.1 Mss4-like protein [Dioszegia hungarica]